MSTKETDIQTALGTDKGKTVSPSPATKLYRLRSIDPEADRNLNHDNEDTLTPQNSKENEKQPLTFNQLPPSIPFTFSSRSKAIVAESPEAWKKEMRLESLKAGEGAVNPCPKCTIL